MALQRFIFDEVGAVTVDWVVLTAAIVGMGIASVAAVRTGVGALADTLQSSLTSASLARLDLNPYQFRAMTETLGYWNNITWRQEQVAGFTDAYLLEVFAVNGLQRFNSAVARQDNSVCHGCNGAGNRLDLMHLSLQEMAQRGLAVQADYDTVADAEQRYISTFGH